MLWETVAQYEEDSTEKLGMGCCITSYLPDSKVCKKFASYSGCNEKLLNKFMKNKCLRPGRVADLKDYGLKRTMRPISEQISQVRNPSYTGGIESRIEEQVSSGQRHENLPKNIK
jgi:hypothetical protein